MIEQEQKYSSRATLLSYFQLMKPGIMVLLVFEAITAMIVAEGRTVEPASILLLGLVGVLASGGSAAINQFLERDRDSLMERTEGRPVASKKIEPSHALTFGLVLISSSLILSFLLFNPMTTLMVLSGAISYIFLYTLYLKPRTMWNIVIGGVAGVFPALAGWSAATGFVGWPGLFIGLLVFLWTPPHFWGLSTKFKEDYKKTGFPMLSVVKSEKQVVHWIVFSSIPLFVFSFVPLALPALGSFNLWYYIAAGILAICFLAVDIQMWRHPSVENSFRAFLVSLPYLFVLFAAMIASSII